MQRAHKIRLNPTPEQKQWLLQACGVARFAFNWGLAEWQKQYEAGGKPSAYGLKKQFNAIRREQFPWSLEVSKCAVDTGFRNLDIAFRNFFRRCKNGDTRKGYPNFKSKEHSRKSFRMDGTRVKTEDHRVKLEHLDAPINMAETLRFGENTASVTLSRDGEHWYISFTCEMKPPPHQHEEASVGVDVGLKTLAVLSNGTQYENQKLLRSDLRKVKRLSRALSRQQKHSGRWQRAKKKLTRLHQHIADKRLDYQHKMTTEIAETYQIIGAEDLNVAGMLRNHHLALSLSDAGFGEIQRQLRYKSEWFGGKLVEVDRFFPSSRLCPICGTIKDDLALSNRVFVCECGYTADRDLNAAQNIEQRALAILAGVGSRRGKTHVEQMSDSPEQFATKRENTAEERQPSRPTQFG